jgi:lysophospholipase L1-like esterase
VSARLALAAVSLLASLLAAEAAVRWIHPQPAGFSFTTRDGIQVHLPDRRGVYRRAEFSIPVRFNALGFRGPEFAVPKPPGTFRVLALGDSLTEAMQVVEEATFVARLERALAPSRPGVEVLNLGVSGYGTDDALDVLRRYGPELAPDLVLLGFTIGNDVRNNLLQGRCALGEGRLACEPLEPLSARRAATRRLRSELANRSQLYQLWRAATDTPWSGQAGAAAAGLDPELAFVVDAHRAPEPTYLADGLGLTAALLDAFAREADRLGAPAWVVLLPTREQVEDARWDELVRRAGVALERERPQRAIARAAAAAGLAVIDPLGAFRAAAAREALFYRIDGHMTEAGHAVAAAEIAASLRAAVGATPAHGVAAAGGVP